MRGQSFSVPFQMCQGKKLEYAPQIRRITNNERANKLLIRNIRQSWEM
jgi:hypothetical protein